jgi:hypothetical protein
MGSCGIGNDKYPVTIGSQSAINGAYGFITSPAAGLRIELPGSALSVAIFTGTSTAPYLLIPSTVTSTSTQSGALQVAGGVGIGGALHVANTSFVAGAQIITTATIGNFASSIGTSTTSTFFINNSTSATSTMTGALRVLGGVGIGGALYVSASSFVNGSQIITADTVGAYITAGQTLKGQYIPRTTSTNAISGQSVLIDASLYDSCVITTNGGTITIGIKTGYVPFDGQKLMIRLYGSSQTNLTWNFNANNFRTVGISPPQVIYSGITMYIGIVYNSSVSQWDILSTVVQ